MKYRKNAVLLEYAILACSILPLVFASSALVYRVGGGFGPIGRNIVAFYQRVITVIALPVP